MRQTVIEKIDVPSEVSLDIIEKKVKIGGQERRFAHPKVEMHKEDRIIVLTAKEATKREKKMLYTFRAHIQNMIKGETNGFEVHLKVCASHFPMTVAVDGDKVVIRNYLGEKVPRKAKILEGVEVKVDGPTISVRGRAIEKVGQTAANIERATKRTGFDRRRFQDGIYIVKRARR